MAGKNNANLEYHRNLQLGVRCPGDALVSAWGWFRGLVRDALQGGIDEQALGTWLQQHVIAQNPAAAFYAYGRARGWEPISAEHDWDGIRAQVWYSPADNMQHVIWARIGEWDRLQGFDRAN